MKGREKGRLVLSGSLKEAFHELAYFHIFSRKQLARKGALLWFQPTMFAAWPRGIMEDGWKLRCSWLYCQNSNQGKTRQDLPCQTKTCG